MCILYCQIYWFITNFHQNDAYKPELPTGRFFRPGLACHFDLIAWPSPQARPGNQRVACRLTWPACRSNQANSCFWFFISIKFYNSILTYSIVPISVIYLIWINEIFYDINNSSHNGKIFKDIKKTHDSEPRWINPIMNPIGSFKIRPSDENPIGIRETILETDL